MDALIQLPGEKEGGPAPTKPTARRTAIALMFVSALVVTITIAVDLAFPAPANKPIGQEARDLAKARMNRNVWDGSAANWAETQLKTRSRVRRSFAPYWSAILMKFMGTVPNDLVAGKDGWLFLRGRLEPPKKARNRSIHLSGLVSAAIERRLSALGSKLIFMPVPRKVVACSEMLPSGVDPDADFDSSVLQTLQQRGLATIDVGALLGTLPVDERYFKLDSHWTFVATRALAELIAETLPEIVTGDVEIEMREDSTLAPAGLLPFAAVDRSHPAASWINQESVLQSRLASLDTYRAFKEKSREVDVALAGSSFTSKFGLAELVAAEIGQFVYQGGIRGTPFVGSLAFFIGAFSKAEFPSHVLYEFPLHQLFALGLGRKEIQRTIATAFISTSHVATMPLPKEFLGAPTVTERKNREIKMVFPAGTLLSSGDGVLQLRLRLALEGKSEWSLRSSDMGQMWTRGKGEFDQLLPVIQTQPIGQSVIIAGSGPRGMPPALEVEVVVDADLARSVAIPLTQQAGSGLRGTLDAPSVGAHDVVTVQWGGRPSSVKVVVRGTTPDGVEREVIGHFKKPLSKICVLSLTPFEGGELDSIEIDGAEEDVQAFVSPQLRD